MNIAKQSTQSEAPIQLRTLYVMLHGEIVIVDDKDPSHPIIAMAPFVPGHAYQAGPWLGEVKIDRGARLQLKGVASSGIETVFSRPDRVVLLDNVPKPKAPPYFAIILPRPEQILPGYVLQLRPGLIKNIQPGTVKLVCPAGSNDPTGMETSMVLKYTVDETQHRVALYDARSGDQMFFPSEGRKDFLSLHVYAAEQFAKATPAHVKAAIKATLDLLGITAAVDPDAQGGAAPPLIIDGLDSAEYTIPLGARTQILGEIGAKHRMGLSVDLAEEFRLAWHPAAPEPHISWTSAWKSAWMSEGTCGHVGASPAIGVSIEDFLG